MKDKNVIEVNHTNVLIPDYDLGDNTYIENLLSVWDKIRHVNIPRGIAYDEENRVLRLPRGIDINRLEKTFDKMLEFNYTPDEYDKCSIRLLSEPRNDLQRKSISFLTGLGGFNYTSKYSQLSLNLDTGDGKTYCVISALTFLKLKAIIFTPIEGIKTQWKESLLKFTDIDEKVILDINSSKVIDKIFKLNSNLPYKVYLVNHRTISNYAKKHGWQKITELFKLLRVGVKIFDEAHIEFYNMVMVDLHTNTKKTIYLTANFERSQIEENKVFNTCYKNIPKYGKETREEKRKHIIYVPVFFNSKPPLEIQASIKNYMGFNKIAYTNYQTSNDSLYNVIKYVLNYFKNKDGKILILLSTIDGTIKVKYHLDKLNLNKSIGVYNSKIKNTEKELVKEMDIIISTQKSMGTGVDISGLRTVIMTESYSSKIIANQTAGRLREIPGEYTFYVELIDEGFADVKRMYNSRLSVFKEKCHSMVKLQYK